MASSKNFFNGLYEILSESQWTNFVSETSTKKSGALAFGHWTTGSGVSQVNVYKIWANSQEYNIADAAAYEALKVKVQNNDASILDISTWKNALTLGAANNKIQIIGDDGIKGSVSVLAGNYVAVSTANSSITVALNNDSIANSSSHTTGDDKKLATVGYVKDVQDGALKEAKISTAVDAGKATVTLTAKNGKNDESTTTYTVKGDSYITIAAGGDDSSIKVELSVDDSKEDIAAATNSSTAIASGYAVKSYVEDKLGNLNALVFKGSISALTDLPDDAKVGDTYVASKDIYEGETEKKKVADAGDMFICSANTETSSKATWARVERNLDGAVTADAELLADRVVLGAGAQGVNTSTYGIGTDDASTIGDSSLATEKFVEKLANAAGGKLAGHKSNTGVVTVDLTSKETGAAQGNLGSVVVKGADNGYVSVDFDNGIKLSTITAEIEGITGSSQNGLATALNVSTAIHSAIEALDVTDTSISGQVVVAVSETDGKVSPTRLGVKVNGQ